MSTAQAIVVDVLESIHLNQASLRAAIEEISLWINERGSTHTHHNITTALEHLDIYDNHISRKIELLRSNLSKG